MTIEFNPPKSLWPFIQSTKFVSLVCGPYGSTKTSAGIMKIAYMAKRVAPCRDGIRRSRAVWVRNTAEQLMDTSIPDFLKWFPDGEAGTFIKTGKRFWLRFDDVECEVLFRGLDDANDVRRLLSLQLTFGIMDEFREISPAIYEALTGRVGRYPDGTMVPHRPEWGVTERGDPVQGCVTDTGAPADAVWGMSNPPDADTYWEELLSNPPDNVHVTIQPSGLSDEADWLHFLKPDYYKNLAVGKSQDWIDVYIHAKFGKSLSGQPVFPGFVPDFHVAKGPLTPVISTAHPLIVGLDFGLTPACTINQQDLRGRFLTYAELTSENMGITRFVREKLKPLLANKFPGHPVIVIGDPAGTQRVQTDERTVFDVLRSEGFRVIPAKTNSIAARIAAVEGLLAGQVDGGPMHLIDPSCKTLIRGLRTGYRYKVRSNGDMDDKPEKNSYSHLLDGHQYACLHVDASMVGKGMSGPRRAGAREVKPVRAAGWT